MILEKQEEIFERNYNRIKVLFRAAYSIGVNLMAASKIKDALKIVHVGLIMLAFLSVYTQYCYLMRNINSIPLIAESIYTALQVLSGTSKLIYFFFTHRTFYRLLDQTLTHDIIYQMEIFQHDFPINQMLKREIDVIMNRVWRTTRFLVLLFFYACFTVFANYLVAAICINLYHQLKETPDYHFILPLPALYTFWESKGMTFPYYHMQMFITTAAMHVSAMTGASFDGTFVVLCQHAAGLMEVHNLLVQHATSPDIPPERRVEYLRYVIKTYQRVNNFTLEIQTIYRHISLAQFLLSLISFGFMLFEANYGIRPNVNNLIRMIMYIMATGTQITIYCYHGQILTNVNEEIPVVYYNCNWYDENKTFKHLIRMMIMRTNKDFYLEVSWFTLMNFATLISLFRASGSYYLILKNFQED
uniref:Odorant receptor n=1 Tax=Zeugodacus tau TaxID=137263 RepID=A0A6M9TZJ3_ZEUTA|nr:odorant receptor [Zeugodacus tau]